MFLQLLSDTKRAHLYERFAPARHRRDFLHRFTLKIHHIDEETLRWFKRRQQAFDQIARSELLVRPDLLVRRSERIDDRFLFFG